MQSGSNPEHSPESEGLKREDSLKNKIHPLVGPPQVHLGDATPMANNNSDFLDYKEKDIKNNENNPLLTTPLSPPNEADDKMRLLEDPIEEFQGPNTSQVSVVKKRAQGLQDYQKYLLPEGITSTEKLLEIYETDRKRKKFEPVREYRALHKDKIECLAVTSDDKFFITGSSDKSIKIIDIETQEEIHHFVDAHEGRITSICVTSDGQFILSGSDDQSMKLWNFKTKQLINHFKEAQNQRITTIKASHDGRFAFTGGADGSVKMFNLQSFQLVHHFQGVHESIKVKREKLYNVLLGPVNSIALTPDDRYLITGTNDKSIGVFEIQTKKLVHLIRNVFPGVVNCVTTSADGRFIIAAETGVWEKKSSTKIYAMENAREVHHFEDIHDGRIKSIAVSPNGKYLVSSDTEGTVQIIDLASRKSTYKYHIFDEASWDQGVNAVAITSDSKYILTGLDAKSVKQLRLEIAEKVCHTLFNAHNGAVSCLLMTPDEKFAVSGSADQSIKVFDVETYKEIHHFQSAHEDKILSLAVTQDSQFLFSGSADKSIKMWSLIERKEVHHFKGFFENDIRSITVIDSSHFIAGASDGFRKFNFQTKEEVHHLKAPEYSNLSATAVTPDGKQFIIGCYNGNALIFDTETFKLIHTFEKADAGGIYSVSVTDDGKSLVASSWNGAFKIFDLETRQELYRHPKEKLNDEVFSVKTIENKYAIFGLKKSIKIFDIQVLRFVHSLLVPGKVQAFNMTKDTRYMFTGSEDRCVRIFCLRPETSRKSTKLELPSFRSSTAITMTPDDKYIIYTREEHKIRYFDIKARKEVYCSDEVHCSKIVSLHVSKDNRLLVSGSSDKSIKIYDIKTRKELHHWIDIQNFLRFTVTITPDSRYVITGCECDFTKVLDTKTFEIVHCFPPGESSSGAYSLAVSSDSKFLVAGYEKDMRIFDLETKQEVFCFKDAHKRFTCCLAFTPDDKYIVSGSSEALVKIFNFHTRQLVHSFEIEPNKQFSRFGETDAYNITRVVVTPDCRYIIAERRDSIFRVYDMESRKIVQEGTGENLLLTSDGKFLLSTQGFRENIVITRLDLDASNKSQTGLNYLQQETLSIHKGVSYPTLFNSTEDFLFDDQLSLDELKVSAVRCQDLIIYPYTWNILHVMALRANHTFIKELSEMSRDLKVPFLLDHFGKTPLHYLMAHRKIDYLAVNSMFSYICDYLEECYARDAHEFQEILKSLSLLLPFIFSKIETKLKERFLLISFASSPVPYSEELPLFGQPASKSCFYELPVLDQHSKSRTWKDGEAQVSCQTNFLYLDYNANSPDMEIMVELMKKQKNEDFFKLPLVSKLLDHLWSQTQPSLMISFLAFSVFMSGLSVYLCLSERNLAFEIVLLALSGIFILTEGLQIYDLGKGYLASVWNWLDLSHLFLTVAFLVTRISGNDNELARAWISTMIVALGYLRWVSYLRIFQATRNLIQVIITIAKDMLSFVVIIAMIIFGFSIIFLVFERENEYGIYLYNTYSILYGPLDIDMDAKYSVSLKLIMVVIAFLLNVLLLNLLISIMGDSYDKILEKRDKTDALTRLEMMSEALTYMKFLKPSYKSKRGYLLYCLSMDVEEDENAPDEWEGRINVMKKLLKQSSEELKDLKGLIEKNNQEMKKELKESNEKLRQDMMRMMRELLQEKDKSNESQK